MPRMVFAHIPAGYLLANEFVKRRRWPTILLWVGMIGGTFPDIDILYAQVTNREFLDHHVFLTHLPVFWFLLAAIVLTIILLARRTSWLPAWAVFFSAVILHLVLDTIITDTYWLAPFSWAPFRLVTVPDRYSWWLLNNVFHWSFLFEIAIIAAAAVVFFRGGWRDLFGIEKKSKFQIPNSK